jgi:hypothetical protein
MAEGNDTPGGEPGRSAQRSEGDLLAERRARRAAESGEVALTRRAEAAEATVQTLERHVASLQQRLREAEDSQRQISESLDVERAAALEREHELRRVKQREYAEQQLRVEAEDRLSSVDHESRVEVDRLAARLGASEDDMGELAARVDAFQLQLAAVEQATVAERAAARRGELELQARIAELERHGSELQRGLERERAARERLECALAGMRESYRLLGGLLGDLKGIVERVIASVDRGQGTAIPTPVRAAMTAWAPPQRAASAELEDADPTQASSALVSASPLPQAASGPAGSSAPASPPAPSPATAAPASTTAPAGAAPQRPGHPTPLEPAFKPRGAAQETHGAAQETHGAEMADALAAAVERLRARAEVAPELAPEHAEEPPHAPAPRVEGAPHKHSMSLITRVRRWRKQRRNR